MTPEASNDNKRPRSKSDTGSGGTCPICKKSPHEQYRPFCSKHCADVDLGRWLSGTYAIPGRPELGEEDR